MTEKSLKELAESFIEHKQNLGYSFVTEGYDLRRLLAYADNSYPGATRLTQGLVKGFLEERAEHEQLGSVASTLRNFGRYLIRNAHPDTYLVPDRIYTSLPAKPPYFFTPEEIKGFFTACDNIPVLKHYPGRHFIIPAFFRLMYCCGLRCIEIRRLRCRNVHVGNLFLDVIESKGLNDRRIYITEELAEYLDRYDREVCIHHPNREFFFPGKCKDGSMSENMVSNNFAALWDEAFPGTRAGFSPRAYDFRHHLAYRVINQWAMDGSDVNAKLPYLMRYMGHKNINNTLYYFHLVPGFFGKFKEISKNLESLIPEVSNEQ